MLASLVPFASQGDVEQIIVDAIKHSYLQARPPATRIQWLADTWHDEAIDLWGCSSSPTAVLYADVPLGGCMTWLEC